jgi:hypothetical protein
MSKEWLDLVVRPNATPDRPEVMVVEATGGLERGIVAALVLN